MRSAKRDNARAPSAEMEIQAYSLAMPDSPRLKLFAIHGAPMPLIAIV